MYTKILSLHMLIAVKLLLLLFIFLRGLGIETEQL